MKPFCPVSIKDDTVPDEQGVCLDYRLVAVMVAKKKQAPSTMVLACIIFCLFRKIND